MSRGWKHSELKYGEELIIPAQMLVSNTTRLKKATYVGENSTCIHIRLDFEKPFCSDEEHWGYTRSVDWAAIYCGHVKLISKDSGEIHAYRRNDITVSNYRNAKIDQHIDKVM